MDLLKQFDCGRYKSKMSTAPCIPRRSPPNAGGGRYICRGEGELNVDLRRVFFSFIVGVSSSDSVRAS